MPTKLLVNTNYVRTCVFSACIYIQKYTDLDKLSNTFFILLVDLEPNNNIQCNGNAISFYIKTKELIDKVANNIKINYNDKNMYTKECLCNKGSLGMYGKLCELGIHTK